jgi:hypothetical protein
MSFLELAPQHRVLCPSARQLVRAGGLRGAARWCPTGHNAADGLAVGVEREAAQLHGVAAGQRGDVALQLAVEGPQEQNLLHPAPGELPLRHRHMRAACVETSASAVDSALGAVSARATSSLLYCCSRCTCDSSSARHSGSTAADCVPVRALTWTSAALVNASSSDFICGGAHSVRSAVATRAAREERACTTAALMREFCASMLLSCARSDSFSSRSCATSRSPASATAAAGACCSGRRLALVRGLMGDAGGVGSGVAGPISPGNISADSGTARSLPATSSRCAVQRAGGL